MEVPSPRVNISELLSPVPLFRKVRFHKTDIGEILCTGKGCVGCFPEKYGDETRKSLGSIDTANLSCETTTASSFRVSFCVPLEKTDQGFPGNQNSSQLSERKARTMKKKISSCSGFFKPSNERDSKETKKNKNKDFQQVNENTAGKKNCSKQRKRGELCTKRTSENVFLRPPILKINNIQLRKLHSEISTPDNKETLKEKGIQPFNVAKRLREIQSRDNVCRLKVRFAETFAVQTNFLQMLKNSKFGIYDSNLIAQKKFSPWVKKVTRSGISEQDILPELPKKKKIVKTRKPILKISGDKALDFDSRKSKNISQIKLDTKIMLQGEAEDSILVVEKGHQARQCKDETALYRLCFALQHFNSIRDLPKLDVLEIAEALSKLVQMGSIRVIQRRGRKWFIIVSGEKVKDALVENGITVRGRNFELINAEEELGQ